MNFTGNHGNPSAHSNRYLIVEPRNGGIRDLVRFTVTGHKESGAKFLVGSDDGVVTEELSGGGYVGDDDDDSGGETPEHRWVIIVSIIARRLISMFGKPLQWTGYVVEYVLNLLSLNGELFGLLCNILRGSVVLPKRGSETFISMIGHLDGRINLYESDILMKEFDEPSFWERNLQIGPENRALMDLCMMAAKLAYENANVVRNVVNLHWGMHFVDFYNCWDDYQKEYSTQVFILCDKPKDANLVFVSFRGTEPFDADDWSTDFDYSWYEIPKVGKVHMGFLEALGLGNRINTSTFSEQLFVKNEILAKLESSQSKGSESSDPLSDANGQIGSDQLSDSELPTLTDRQELIPGGEEMTAYYSVRSKLKSLFKEHKRAKFVVTGHSLGGALAILFPTVLVLHDQEEIMKRCLGVCTYGQPRVGNRRLGMFMEAHLQHPAPRYFRVVYCNDLVPRLPYDDKTFLYKHFGACLYYDSFYIEQHVDEEPNRNYFELRYLIPARINAVWELIRSLTMGYTHGPEYKESWESVLLRVLGLAIPGLSAHSPVNYVNSVRLGRRRNIQMASL